MIQSIKTKTIESYLSTRSMLYLLESLPLPYIHKYITGTKTESLTKEEHIYFISLIRELIQIDAQHCAEGLYSTSLLPERPQKHFSQWLEVLADSAFAAVRRRNKKTQAFSKKADSLEGLPEYYKRNFHHQTDGYLSENSAKLYDHQVELLFRGLAAPMRRRLIQPLRAQFKKNAKIKILELACGTGSFTKTLTDAFPQAQITAIDLSPSYIKYVRERLAKHKNLHFLCENAEDLPFKDKHFDAVVSVFLHHELPQKARYNVIEESFRVLGNNGFWGMIDSIQWDDNPRLNKELSQFPQIFHEPFYKNYIKTPIKDLIRKTHPDTPIHQEVHFLSKLVHTLKKTI